MESPGDSKTPHSFQELSRYTSQLPHHTGVYELRRLPPEILSIIFLYCLNSRWQDPEWPLRSSSHPSLDTTPLLLGRICRRWRAVTLSTPQLWAHLSLNLTPETSSNVEALADLWLSRGGSCALTVRLVYEGTIHMPTIIHQIASHCERLEHLAIWSLYHTEITEFSVMRNRVPSLKVLELDGYEWSSALDTFEFAPNLRKIVIGYLSEILFTLLLPWQQVTVLIIKDLLSTGVCLKALHGCPNLVECKFSIGMEALIPAVPGDGRVRLELLSTLCIHFSVEMCGFWDNVSLPCLRDCQITFELGFGPMDEEFVPHWDGMSNFIEFITRSECSLQKLVFDFHDISIADVDLIACLKSTPALIELVLVSNAFLSLTKDSLAALTYNTSTKCLIPDLQILKVGQGYYLAIEDEGFATMIYSRWRSDETVAASGTEGEIARLNVVEVGQVEESDLAHIPCTVRCLRRCKDEGMSTGIFYSKVTTPFHKRTSTSWLQDLGSSPGHGT